jgi:hypothetical protein
MPAINELERWSPLVLARISGILGLIGIAFGAFDIGHIRGALIVAGNPSLTAHNILAHETLFRLGFTGHLLEMLCNAFAEVIGFYLFWRVNLLVAAIALFCGFLGIAVESLDMLNSYVPLKLAAEAGSMGAFSPEQLQSLSYFSVQLQDTGLVISFLFYGMDELLTGYLVFRSRFLPRVLGVLGAIAGLCYLTNTILSFAAPRARCPTVSLYPLRLLSRGGAEQSLAGHDRIERRQVESLASRSARPGVTGLNVIARMPRRDAPASPPVRWP